MDELKWMIPKFQILVRAPAIRETALTAKTTNNPLDLHPHDNCMRSVAYRSPQMISVTPLGTSR